MAINDFTDWMEDVALDEASKRIAELEQQLSALREALRKISRMSDCRMEYWNNQALSDAVSVASEALIKQEGEG